MTFYLTLQEVMFISHAMNIEKLFLNVYSEEEAKKLNDEAFEASILEGLEEKGYIISNDKDVLQIQNLLVKALSIYKYPTYSISLLKPEAEEEMVTDRFLVMNAAGSLEVFKNNDLYEFEFSEDEEDLVRKITSWFNLKNQSHEAKMRYTIPMSIKVFDDLLGSYFEGNVKRTQKQLNKLGLDEQEGKLMLKTIMNGNEVYGVIEETKPEKEYVIKICTSDEYQYIIKKSNDQSKIVLIKQDIKEATRSLINWKR